MADNPLEQDPARDARIKERAYHLWESEGRPHGRHAEYWERASELVRMEESGMPGQLPNPATVPGADPNRTEPIEEAFLEENLGEFPDRFTDQGDTEPTPRAARARRKSAMPESPAPGAAGPAADQPPRTPPARKRKPKA